MGLGANLTLGTQNLVNLLGKDSSFETSQGFVLGCSLAGTLVSLTNSREG